MVGERLQSFFLQIEVPEIVILKADQPNTFPDFLDTQSLPRKDRAEINFFAVQTDGPTVINTLPAGRFATTVSTSEPTSIFLF